MQIALLESIRMQRISSHTLLDLNIFALPQDLLGKRIRNTICDTVKLGPQGASDTNMNTAY